MRNQKGFTLIELAIVVAIIATLALIAIPQFSKYRASAYDDTAISALRSAVTCQEAYFTDNHSYTADIALLTNQYNLTGLDNGKVTLAITATSTNFTMTARHASGKLTYVYEGPGGAIKSQ